MPSTVIAEFQVQYRQVLNPAGELVEPLPICCADPQQLLDGYRWMVLTRAFDQKAIALQRTGQLRTYPSCLGQEAIAVALGASMRPEDVLLPSYREPGTLFMRGVQMEEILLYWGGDERGSDFSSAREDYPFAVPIASHTVNAVGVAYAMQLRAEARVAVCTLGDGGTSKGDFYEAMNAAGVWRLPLVFVVSNNQWAISMPRQQQSACQTIAQKAIAAGIPSMQVDGNDLFACRAVFADAIEQARRGGGPMLIEALTYRLGDHTTADDARRYRSAEALSEHWKLEPVVRLRRYLLDNGWWGKDQEAALNAEVAEQVGAATAAYLATPVQPVESIFDFMYASPTAELVAQRAALLAETQSADREAL